MSVQTTTVRTSGGAFAFLNNLRIGPKIIAGYLLLILLMAGVAGVAYWGMTRIVAADKVALKHQATVADLWAMQMYMDNQYGNQADLIINDDRATIEEFRTSVELMDEKKELVRAALETAEEQQLMADIDRIDSQFDALFFEQIVPAWEAGDEELLTSLDDQGVDIPTQFMSFRGACDGRIKEMRKSLRWLVIRPVGGQIEQAGLKVGQARSKFASGPAH